MERNSFSDYRAFAYDGLSLEEAEEIYCAMYQNLDFSDEDIKEIWEEMIGRALRYSAVRSGWLRKTRDEKIRDDDERTNLHNQFINSVDQLIFLQTKEGKDVSWGRALGSSRKRIGDLACYIALFQGLNGR